MRWGRAWSRFDSVCWSHVDWLMEHPEHIDRDRPSHEEEIALWRLHTKDPLALPVGEWPVLPPPLEHFDKPQHHRRPGLEADTDHIWLQLAIGRWFAGFHPRPSPGQVREYLLAPTLETYADSYPRQVLHNIFSCMQPADMFDLWYAERLTIHELARALRHSEVRRSGLVKRLSYYADPPLRPRYLDFMPQDG